MKQQRSIHNPNAALHRSNIALGLSALMLGVTALGMHEQIFHFVGITPPAAANREHSSVRGLVDYLADPGRAAVDGGVLAPESEAQRLFRSIQRVRIAHTDTFPEAEVLARSAEERQDGWHICSADNSCTIWSEFRFDQEGRIATARWDGRWFEELLVSPGNPGVRDSVYVTPTAGVRRAIDVTHYALAVRNQAGAPITVTRCALSDSATGQIAYFDVGQLIMDPWTQLNVFCGFESKAVGSPQHVGLEFSRGSDGESEIVWVTFEPEV